MPDYVRLLSYYTYGIIRIMIFLDQTGKRWKRVKRSVFASVLAVVVPIAVLAVGGYTFNPGWATLSFGPVQVFHPQSFLPIKAPAVTTTGTTNKSHGTNNNVASANQSTGTAVLGAATTSTSTAGTSPTTPPSSTTTPTTTSTTCTTPSSTNANGGNSTFGKSHHC